MTRRFTAAVLLLALAACEERTSEPSRLVAR